MGMSVYGKEPTTKEGEYFRRNVWGWRGLADFCTDMAPQICATCKYWQSNDGDGLGKADSLRLATEIRAMIKDRRADEYIRVREHRIKLSLPKRCFCCHGSGIRNDAVGIESGWPQKKITCPAHPRFGETGSCNACEGFGFIPNDEHSYFLDIKDLEQFATFLEGCGGFSID